MGGKKYATESLYLSESGTAFGQFCWNKNLILLKKKKTHTIITLLSDEQWRWFISQALLNILIQERYPWDGSGGLQLDQGLQSENLFRLFSFFCLNRPHFSISATDTMSTTETTNVTSEAEVKMRLFLLTPFLQWLVISQFSSFMSVTH